MSKSVGRKLGRGVEGADALGQRRHGSAAGSKRSGGDVSARNVGCWGRRDVNAIRHRPRALLRLFGVLWFLGRLLLSAARSSIRPTVFLNELHGGVIFGRILELLNRLAALFLKGLELGFEAVDAEIVVARDDEASCVDAVQRQKA